MKHLNPAHLPLAVCGSASEAREIARLISARQAAEAAYMARVQMMVAHDDVDQKLIAGLEEQRAAGETPAKRVHNFEKELDLFCNYVFALSAARGRQAVQSEPVLRGCRV